jgi:nitrate reductase cytochrome c-type subunit
MSRIVRHSFHASEEPAAKKISQMHFVNVENTMVAESSSSERFEEF